MTLRKRLLKHNNDANNNDDEDDDADNVVVNDDECRTTTTIIVRFACKYFKIQLTTWLLLFECAYVYSRHLGEPVEETLCSLV